MRTRPTVVAFDVVETLFSLDALRGRFQEAGLPPSAVQPWFTRFLRDAFALNVAGIYRPFREIAAGGLEVLLVDHGLPAGRDGVDRILSGFGELQPHPDVAPAMRVLAEAGIRMIALTNGSAENTRSLFKNAGLDSLIERVVSIDEVRRWKPSREVYLHAAKVVQVAPEDLALVAVHAWDVMGAARAGLVAAWAAREEKAFPSFVDPPDVVGATLVDVATGLLKLPAK